jgi:cellobiose phosphorylase
VPTTWSGFQVQWRIGEARYLIDVSNPHHHSRGVGKATLDGAAVDPAAVPFVDDGRSHELRVVLGSAR